MRYALLFFVLNPPPPDPLFDPPPTVVHYRTADGKPRPCYSSDSDAFKTGWQQCDEQAKHWKRHVRWMDEVARHAPFCPRWREERERAKLMVRYWSLLHQMKVSTDLEQYGRLRDLIGDELYYTGWVPPLAPPARYRFTKVVKRAVECDGVWSVIEVEVDDEGDD